MFEGLFQPTHLILILIIVLIVFGPGKLPEIGGALGRSMREFKRSSSDDSDRSEKAAGGNVVQLATGKKVCPACQTENSSGNKFCGTCGKDLS